MSNAPFTYGTVCSGIGAPEMAWGPLGWKSVFTSEIDKFPSEVLKARYDSPNLGDMTKYKEWPNYENLGLICGGTPCQSFSVAGLRKGMDDPRGNLALTFIAIINRYRPRWFIWENVPGVLSSSEGRDFGSFIGAVGAIGYGFAYRLLNADGFGIPQHRRRIFVVGFIGDWRPPYKVLFEREGVRGDTPEIVQEGQGNTREAMEGSEVASMELESYTPSSIGGYKKGVGTLMANGGDNGGGSEILVLAHGQANAEIVRDGDPSLTCNHEAPIVVHARQNPISKIDKALPLDTRGDSQAVAFSGRNRGPEPKVGRPERPPHAMIERVGALETVKPWNVAYDTIARRITPIESERLQGFPDNHTKIAWRGKAIEDCPDGPRYKALGNTMAVPVVNWLGRRIQLYEDVVNN